MLSRAIYIGVQNKPPWTVYLEREIQAIQAHSTAVTPSKHSRTQSHTVTAENATQSRRTLAAGKQYPRTKQAHKTQRGAREQQSHENPIATWYNQISS